MNKTIVFLLSSLFLYNVSSSQSDEYPELFHKYTDEQIKELCWNNSGAEYARTDIPEKMTDEESAVIILDETIYEATTSFNIATYVSYLRHLRIKLLDQAALDNFSTIYLNNYTHGAYYIQTRQKFYVGFKIIKPSGKEIIVDNSKIIEEDENKRKLAVPDLDIGDIIDYYIFSYDYVTNMYDVGYEIIDDYVVAKKYPTLNFKFKLTADDGVNVYFKKSGDLSEIKESTKGKKDQYNVFEINDENIPRMATELWNYTYRTSPYIQLIVGDFKKRLIQINKDQKRIDNVTTDELLEEYESMYKPVNNSFASSIYNSFKFYMRKNGLKEASKEKILEEYYYYMRHKLMNAFYLEDNYNEAAKTEGNDDVSPFVNPENLTYRKESDYSFAVKIIYVLRKYEIPFEIFILTDRRYGSIEDLIHIRRSEYIIKAKLDKPVYFFNPTPFTNYNEIPYYFEGNEAYAVYPSDDRNDLLINKKIVRDSDPEKSVGIYKTTLTIPENYKEKIDVKTEAILSGYTARNYKHALSDWVEDTWKENEKYNTVKWGKLEYGTKKQKLQIEEYLKDRANDRKDNYFQFAKDHFDTEDIELIDFKSEDVGNGVGNYDFKFSFDCKIGGIVNKVGPNYILKIGNLIGGQVTLDEEDQERTVEVYMNYARSFDYSIKVEIPDGYEVKGLKSLNLDIENKTGYVKSECRLDGNTIIFSYKKQYKHNFEKAEDWPLMKEFLVPASLLTSKEILLKKK